MIKPLEDYSDKEKIELFDKTYKRAKNEFNESRYEEEWDYQYFWEDMLSRFLGNDIWKM